MQQQIVFGDFTSSHFRQGEYSQGKNDCKILRDYIDLNENENIAMDFIDRYVDFLKVSDSKLEVDGNLMPSEIIHEHNILLDFIEDEDGNTYLLKLLNDETRVESHIWYCLDFEYWSNVFGEENASMLFYHFEQFGFTKINDLYMFDYILGFDKNTISEQKKIIGFEDSHKFNVCSRHEILQRLRGSEHFDLIEKFMNSYTKNSAFRSCTSLYNSDSLFVMLKSDNNFSQLYSESLGGMMQEYSADIIYDSYYMDGITEVNGMIEFDELYEKIINL